MQPYQRAEEAVTQRQERDTSLIKNIGRLGAEAALLYSGTSLIPKILPYLGRNITAETAIRGLKKISPALSNFIKEAQNTGKSFSEIKDFLKEKMVEATENAPKNLFQRLAGDVDFSQLDEKTTKELSFLSKIADQLEQKGKTEKDPEVKKLAKRIKKALEGITGMIDAEAMAQEQLDPSQITPEAGQAEMGPNMQRLMALLQQIQSARSGQ